MKSALTTLCILIFITSCTTAFAQSYEIDSVIKEPGFNEYTSSSRNYYGDLIDVIGKFTITIKEGDLAIVSMEKSDWKLLFRFYRNANRLKISQEDYLKVNEFNCTSDLINGINYIEMSVERVSGEIALGEMKFYPEEGLYKPVFTVKFSSLNVMDNSMDLNNVLDSNESKPLVENEMSREEKKIWEQKKIEEINNRPHHAASSNNSTNSSQNKSPFGASTASGKPYSLEGRSVVSLPPPNYPGYDQGVVVVKIAVDKFGKVTFAEPGATGTTLTNKRLWDESKLAALKAKFNTDEDAPNLQNGTITYRFVLN